MFGSHSYEFKCWDLEHLSLVALWEGLSNSSLFTKLCQSKGALQILWTCGQIEGDSCSYLRRCFMCLLTRQLNPLQINRPPFFSSALTLILHEEFILKAWLFLLILLFATLSARATLPKIWQTTIAGLKFQTTSFLQEDYAESTPIFCLKVILLNANHHQFPRIKVLSLWLRAFLLPGGRG